MRWRGEISASVCHYLSLVSHTDLLASNHLRPQEKEILWLSCHHRVMRCLYNSSRLNHHGMTFLHTTHLTHKPLGNGSLLDLINAFLLQNNKVENNVCSINKNYTEALVIICKSFFMPGVDTMKYMVWNELLYYL